MTRLNQLIAIEKGIKSKTNAETAEVHKLNQKPDLFGGFVKTYQKLNDEGEELPGEKKLVQLTVGAQINRAVKRWEELFEVTFRKDVTNGSAMADVVVDGKVLVAQAPVSYLLFLEKQLTDVRTFVTNLPVLDDSETWNPDVNTGLYRSEETKTHRTKKVQKALVKYDATDKHPAQTEMITVDELVGYWNNVKFSGAIPKPHKIEIIDRIDNLIRAVKTAREEANQAEVISTVPVGDAIFGYVFG